MIGARKLFQLLRMADKVQRPDGGLSASDWSALRDRLMALARRLDEIENTGRLLLLPRPRGRRGRPWLH